MTERVRRLRLVPRRSHSAVGPVVFVVFVVIFFFVLVSVETKALVDNDTNDSDRNSINDNSGTADWVTWCRSKGFDPWQLACSTCSLLAPTTTSTTTTSSTSTDHRSNAVVVQGDCNECCQSYKDASKLRTKPYDAAVLVVPTMASARRQQKNLFFNPLADEDDDDDDDNEDNDDDNNKEEEISDSSNPEVSTLLKEDWDEMVEKKGKHRLGKVRLNRKVVQKQYKKTEDQQRYMRYLMMGFPAQVLFFDNNNNNNNNDDASAVDLSSMEMSHKALIQKAAEVISLDSLKRDDIKDMILTLLA